MLSKYEHIKSPLCILSVTYTFPDVQLGIFGSRGPIHQKGHTRIIKKTRALKEDTAFQISLI